MKNPVLNLESFLNNNDSLLIFDSDELTLVDHPFHFDEYKITSEIVQTKSIEKADSYKPHKTRGIKENKEGYCLPCDKWFKLKNSSYWYHMNFKHGINSKGMKYPEPEIRRNNGKLEGFCEACDGWITVGYKFGDKNYKFGWYRHCQKEHRFVQ